MSRGGIRLSAREFEIEVGLSKQVVISKQKELKKNAEISNKINEGQLNKLKDIEL